MTASATRSASISAASCGWLTSKGIAAILACVVMHGHHRTVAGHGTADAQLGPERCQDTRLQGLVLAVRQGTKTLHPVLDGGQMSRDRLGLRARMDAARGRLLTTPLVTLPHMLFSVAMRSLERRDERTHGRCR
ncbi:MAG TPA: hypothetical protein VH877_02885 [Polyangia bacterium]|jgi:hypothetical protein|nr:hypothetical protein [Polyangia bacterium]